MIRVELVTTTSLRTAGSVAILGGGFGGIVVANRLRKRLGSEHRILILDRKASFFMGLAKLWVLTGQRRPDEQKSLKALEAKKITVVQAEVTKINPAAHEITTSAGTYNFDFLVIALGAETTPEAVPGFVEGAHNLYDIDGSRRLGEAIRKFAGGKLVLAISGLPFKCPPSPYEAAFLIDEMLRNKGVRAKTDFQMFTPEPFPLPVGGPNAGARVKELLIERGISYNSGKKLKTVDPASKRVVFEDGTKTSYDLLVGVPIHSVPRVVKDSGLAGPSGWIPVDKKTLRTSWSRVYAIGDVAAVMTANNLLLPRSGILAEEEAKVVANKIASEILGRREPAQFEGRGDCFLEVGGGKAALIHGDFLAEPVPKVEVSEPSAEGLQSKIDFEASRLAAWFS